MAIRALPFSPSAALVFALVGAALAACSSSSPSAESASPDGAGGSDAGATTDAGAEEASTPSGIGSCKYSNPFSKGGECKGYTGAGWTVEDAKADCAAAIGGAGTFVEGGACAFDSALGECAVSKDGGKGYVIVSEGSDASKCGGAKTGCETFAGGKFAPAAICAAVGASDAGSGGGGYGSVPFVQPYRTCRAPLPGEPAGASPGGQVCTWTLISGSTEAGRRFDDYASCDDVLTQRPYWASAPRATTDAADPRLADAAYMTEVAWARTQVEASACVCCHSKRLAPSGPSQWLTDAEGVWLDGIEDSGLAMMAGLAASDALGAFAAADNNGFDRTALGVPTTDVPRMRALLLAEWARRGLGDADAAKVPPFGGPLVTQQSFVPSACAAGEGVGADGAITWSGGAARYVYVLEASAKNPGVPPNLDEPAGTVFLADVPSTSAPFASGLRFGDVPAGGRRRVPASGAPAALTPGATYYLYVLKDVAYPITRCLFTAP